MKLSVDLRPCALNVDFAAKLSSKNKIQGKIMG
jgi:hypothetical protein